MVRMERLGLFIFKKIEFAGWCQEDRRDIRKLYPRAPEPLIEAAKKHLWGHCTPVFLLGGHNAVHNLFQLVGHEVDPVSALSSACGINCFAGYDPSKPKMGYYFMNGIHRRETGGGTSAYAIVLRVLDMTRKRKKGAGNPAPFLFAPTGGVGALLPDRGCGGRKLRERLAAQQAKFPLVQQVPGAGAAGWESGGTRSFFTDGIVASTVDRPLVRFVHEAILGGGRCRRGGNEKARQCQHGRKKDLLHGLSF